MTLRCGNRPNAITRFVGFRSPAREGVWDRQGGSDGHSAQQDSFETSLRNAWAPILSASLIVG